MTDIANTARKNDIVAIEVRHSYQMLTDGRHEYTRWHLATVTRASREGVVREVQMAGSFHSLRAAAVGKVFTIRGEMQPVARLAVEAIKSPTDNSFDTSESLRDFVRAHAAIAA